MRILGKGSKERFVPIGEEAIHWLNIYLGRTRPQLSKGVHSKNIVFLNNRGKQLSRMGFWKILRKYTVSAHITHDVHPHTFRHCFATHLLDAGADKVLLRGFTAAELFNAISRLPSNERG